ncbi:MFS transporter [Streptomyces sp. TLI_105]|uniref:MFS transporter n=1 Tax=Streptomyces sp. TLI_105 TaxID=1881019 RepID=UPI000899A313|nr:MFS transporter [Streptomyces sp. TLI_105]SEE07642.1 drug resistance transporter, EmrB/QacA subfamily [Streptomyces sp. TLI_105]
MSTVDESASRRTALLSPPAALSWGPVTIVLIGAFMAILDSFIVIVAGPAIQADLGASDAELQWILAGYQLAHAVFLITGGRLGDLYGRRRAFIGGMAVFTLASVACAVAQTPTGLIVARLVEGLGAALMLPQVYALITVLVPERERHRAFSALGVVMGLATVGGLLVGADLLGSGWRPVFWINIPVGIVAVLLAARYVPESRAPHGRRLDLPGVAVLSVTLFLLAFPLIQGRHAGWPWWTWSCLAASLLGFALFIALERRTASLGGDPLVRMSLFRTRSFSVGILLVLATYTVITSYHLVLSIALQDGLGMSALGAGLVYTPAAVTFFLFSLIAGRLVPRYGRRVLAAGAIVLALGYASTAVVLTCGLPFRPAVVIPTLMVQSAGGGLLITPSLGAVLARIGPADAGIASGVLSTAQQVGAALGVAIIGVVFFHSFAPAGGRSAAAHALAVSSVATLVTALVAAALIRLLPDDRHSVADRA